MYAHIISSFDCMHLFLVRNKLLSAIRSQKKAEYIALAETLAGRQNFQFLPKVPNPKSKDTHSQSQGLDRCSLQLQLAFATSFNTKAGEIK